MSYKMKKKYLIFIKPAAILPQAVIVWSGFVLSKQNVTWYQTNVRPNSNCLRKYGAGLIKIRCCLMQRWFLYFGPINFPTFLTEVFPQYVGVLEERPASIPISVLEIDEEFSEVLTSYYSITQRHITEKYDDEVDFYLHMYGEPWVTISSVTYSVLKDVRGLPQSSQDIF
jgi:hypothetical protein